MSQNARELSARFVHLLQPIRDLTHNWDIDVASQLEEYMEEIEQITISFDGGQTTMNFVEAAFLIQGSTCIYSKKVEYLYSLVYQTLDLIASKKKLAQVPSVDDEGTDRDATFAQRNDEDDFLSLDMVEAKNIDMDEKKNQHFKSVSIVQRTPLSLIPRQGIEKNTSTPLISRAGEVLGSKADFMMNSSMVHCSGALLLEPMNQFMLSVKMANRDNPIPITSNTPAKKINEMLRNDDTPLALRHEDGEPMYDDMDDYCNEDGDDYHEGGTKLNSHTDHSPINAESNKNGKNSRPLRVRLQEEEKIIDPWTLLDPHDKGPTAENKPFKKGTTYKILPNLLKNTSRKRKNTDNVPKESLSKFLLRSVYSCSSMFPKNFLKAPSSSEFEGYFWAEMKNRLQQKRQDNIKLIQMRKEHALLLEEEAKKEEDAEQDNVEDYHPLGDEYSDNEVHDGGLDGAFEGAFDNYTGDLHDNLVAMVTDPKTFHGVEPMALDGLSGEERQLNYEDLVKNYVERAMHGVQAYIQETELSKRVQQWEDKIRQKLEVEEQYPVFDIHAYGAQFISEFEKKNENGTSWFSDLMSDKERYEISRTLVATLQLANDYNVRISCEGSGESAVNTMTVTLLNTELPHKTLTTYKAPSLHSNTSTTQEVFT